jgi:hypothetical protein
MTIPMTPTVLAESTSLVVATSLGKVAGVDAAVSSELAAINLTDDVAVRIRLHRLEFHRAAGLRERPGRYVQLLELARCELAARPRDLRHGFADLTVVGLDRCVELRLGDVHRPTRGRLHARERERFALSSSFGMLNVSVWKPPRGTSLGLTVTCAHAGVALNSTAAVNIVGNIQRFFNSIPSG